MSALKVYEASLVIPSELFPVLIHDDTEIRTLTLLRVVISNSHHHIIIFTVYLFSVRSLLRVSLVLGDLRKVTRTLEERDVIHISVLRVPIGMVVAVQREVNGGSMPG